MFDGVWLLATRHRPGLSKHMFEINNRCFVFRLYDQQAGRPVLLVVNAVDPEQGIPEVRRLERETGLAVAAIVSPGGGHHLHMAAVARGVHRPRSCSSVPSASRAPRTGAS